MVITRVFSFIPDWYKCTYNMCGRICTGYGRNYAQAVNECLSDMNLIASL